MRFIVKFGKEVIQGIDFPDNRSARLGRCLLPQSPRLQRHSETRCLMLHGLYWFFVSSTAGCAVVLVVNLLPIPY